MSYEKLVKKNTHPYLESLRDDIRARRDPFFFWPTGTQVYCGRQGAGKTTAAVKHLLDLKRRYPKLVIVSNISLNYMKPYHFSSPEELEYFVRTRDPQNEYISFSTMKELEIALTAVNNGHYGVIYLIDEIHTYFNALESSNIPMFVFTEISQQRKQRKCIVGTSQVFMRMAKPFREQCDNLIMCRTIASFFTVMSCYDGMELTQDYDGKIMGKRKKLGWFFHNRKIRGAFDTYQKVVSGAEQYEAQNEFKIVKNKKKEIIVEVR